ncbi:MAG: B12-binding domain-containing radical SAM protein [Sedimentisphaerales bacterium]|nr:B12-binding domain-containing radical SAM protein [Sedimentisphaerales bacterium]
MFDSSKKRFLLRIVIPAYPAFNIYSRIAKRTTALGAVCVASAANKMEKWDVEVIDENNLGKLGPRSQRRGADHEFLQSQRPADVVGLYGGLTSTIPRLYEIASFYRKHGVITIAGGQHFVEETIPEALCEDIDYLVLGEGEETITELLQAIEGNRDTSDIKGLAYLKNGEPYFTEKREPLTDFDKLPLPDFSLVRYAKIKTYPVERIRGCGMNCEFCTVKGKPRAAEPARLLEHIRLLVETYNAKNFFIVDDLFGQQRDETIRFCRTLEDYQRRIGRRLGLTVQIRLDKAKDKELLSAMRGAGIRTICIGYESPIEEELETMNKHIRAEDMLSLTRRFHKTGFFIHGMFIFCYPIEDNSGFRMPVNERARRYRKFIRKAKIDTVQILLPVPIPGTELRDRLQKQKRIYPSEDIGWEYYDGSFPLFEPDEPLNSEQIQQTVRKIMGRFYRFGYMFLVPFHILSFTGLVFFFHNLRQGFRRWYRPWRNHLIRFGGWTILRKWTIAFRSDKFLEKLRNARQHLSHVQ